MIKTSNLLAVLVFASASPAFAAKASELANAPIPGTGAAHRVAFLSMSGGMAVHAAKLEHAAKPERVAKPERPAKPDRPEIPAKPERPEIPARPERPGR